MGKALEIIILYFMYVYLILFYIFSVLESILLGQALEIITLYFIYIYLIIFFYIFCFWKLNGGFIITVYLWGSACNYQSSKAPMCFMCWKCTLVSRMYFDPPNSPPLSGMIISQVFQVTRSTSPLLGQLWEHSNREWDKFGFTI